MSISQLVAEARQRAGMTQHDLATKTNYSRSRIANHEAGHREIHKEDWPSYCQGLDDALFTLELHKRATGGVYIPYLDGHKVEHHYSALIQLARKELREAKEHLKEIDASKPISAMEEFEREHIERTLEELLDASAASLTLIIDLCSRFDLSFNTVVKRWIVRLTANQMLERRAQKL